MIFSHCNFVIIVWYMTNILLLLCCFMFVGLYSHYVYCMYTYILVYASRSLYFVNVIQYGLITLEHNSVYIFGLVFQLMFVIYFFDMPFCSMMKHFGCFKDIFFYVFVIQGVPIFLDIFCKNLCSLRSVFTPF